MISRSSVWSVWNSESQSRADLCSPFVSRFSTCNYCCNRHSLWWYTKEYTPLCQHASDGHQACSYLPASIWIHLHSGLLLFFQISSARHQVNLVWKNCLVDGEEESGYHTRTCIWVWVHANASRHFRFTHKSGCELTPAAFCESPAHHKRKIAAWSIDNMN